MRIAAILLGLGLAAGALAGPPFNTDDPVPVEKLHWEIYLASIYNRDHGGAAGTFPHLDMNYGITPDIHVHLQTPLAFSAPSGESQRFGYGDTEIGAKIRLTHESKGSPEIALYPAIDFPTGAASRDLGTGATHWYLPIWLQKTFGEWTCYGGGGFWHNPGPGNRDYWFSGIVLTRQMTKQFAFGGELFHTTSAAVGEPAHTGFDFGGTYDFDDEHHIMLSLGRDLSGGTTLSGYLAFQWTFGPHEKKAK